MKKMLALFIPLVLLVGGIGYADNSLTAPYGFVITNPTTTTLTVSWSDSNDIAPDSLAIMRLSGSDSLHITYMVAGSTDTTLTGLIPHTQYVLYYKILRGDSCVVSNEDTMFTAYPELERRRSSMEFPERTEMYGARSWLSSAITYDTLYVSKATGLDSTMVYYTDTSMYLQIYATGDGDSVATKFLIFDGHTIPTNVLNYGVHTRDQNEQWGFSNAATDSVTITRSGWSIPHKLAISHPSHFYIRADGQAAISNDTVANFVIRLFRRRD